MAPREEAEERSAAGCPRGQGGERRTVGDRRRRRVLATDVSARTRSRSGRLAVLGGLASAGAATAVAGAAGGGRSSVKMTAGRRRGSWSSSLSRDKARLANASVRRGAPLCWYYCEVNDVLHSP